MLKCGTCTVIVFYKVRTIFRNYIYYSDTETAASGKSSTGSQEQPNGVHEVDGLLNGTLPPSEISKTPPNQGRRPQDLHSPQQPKSLRHEFELVNVDLPNVKVYEVND